MTNIPDQLDLEGGKAKSLGEKFFDVLVPFGHTWANFPGDLKVSYERHALAFAASLTHDETATAAVADLEGRLRASEAECEQLRLAICGGEDAPGHAMSLPLQTVLDIQRDNFAVSRSALERLWSVEALATSQAETIRGLTEALSDVRKLIAEGAMSGFNPLDGNWADRLFISQRRTTAALSRTPSGEARPDTGEQSQ